MLLRKYVENDNKRIESTIKKINNFFNKLLFKRKQKFFYNLCAKIYSYKHKEEYSIHNKLFNDFKKKQKILNDLEKRIYQDEEEKYTFSPKINYNKIKNYNSNSKFEMKINNRRYSYSLKSPSTKLNKNSIQNKKNKNIQNLLLNEKISKTSTLFCPNINSYRSNKDEKFHQQNNNINELIKNNQNFINGIDNNLYLNLMYNKDINNIPKNDLINLKYFNKDYEKDFINKTSRNFYGIRKTKSANKNNSAIYLRAYDDAFNNFETIKIENKTIKNIIPKMNTSSAMLIEDNNNGMNSYNNLKHNKIKNNNIPSINNLYPNGKKYSQLLMKNGASYYLIDRNNNKDMDNYDKCKMINRNESSEAKDKKQCMLNDLYNIKDNEKPINRNKRINSLQKNKLSSFNGIIPISTSSCKHKNKYKNIIYEPIKRNYKTIDSEREAHNNNIIYKKSKSLNSNNLYNEASPFVLNINKDNYIYNEYKSLDNKYSNTNNNNEFNNENKLNNYTIKNNSNKILSKKEYYYTFRKGKIPYNSFNYLTNKKSKNKMCISKNKNPISLIDDYNKNYYYYSANYNSNLARTNRIYLNNYNKKICGIKMESTINSNNNNNSFNGKKNNNNVKNYNKGSFYELTNKKDIISNNYTNYETKGCSFSSYSLYHTKSPKENKSIKNTSMQENNNSINYSKSKNKSLSKQSTLSKKKLKKRGKIDNIIKIPNRISEFNYEEKKNDNEDENMNENKIKKYEVDSKVVNECCIHKKNLALYDQKILVTGSNSKKNDKSMTLQSLSDSKMLELAEHYINNDEDSMDQMDYRMMKFKKNLKMERNYRDITFG